MISADLRAAGGEALVHSLDVTSRASGQAFADAVLARWCRIDVLLSNAGIMPLSPLAAGLHDEWDGGWA